jgi:predicted RNA-binding Zn ribbon-like protein
MTSRDRSQHPLDSAELMLPEPSWPDEPGSAGVLEPLRRFCNTTNRENGADAWRTPTELAVWLDREGYGRTGFGDATTLARLVTLRDALWRAIATNDFRPLARASQVVTLRVEATNGGVVLAPVRSGIDAVVARLLLVLYEAQATGVLDRMKCCQHCQWVFHDSSKNRRGRWCSMTACGSRSKARAYRRRRADELARTRRTEQCS